MRKKAVYVDFNGIKLSPAFFDAVALEPDTIGFDPAVPYLELDLLAKVRSVARLPTSSGSFERPPPVELRVVRG